MKITSFFPRTASLLGMMHPPYHPMKAPSITSLKKQIHSSSLKITLGIMLLIHFSFVCISPVSAATIDIGVAPENDITSSRDWYPGGSFRSTFVNANPNQISHWYGDSSTGGTTYATSWTFDLSTAPDMADVTSVTFNYDVLNVWATANWTGTPARNDVATLSTGDTFYLTDGLGWKSFDVTDDAITWSGSTATLSGSHTGWAGLTIGAAEGDLGAYLSYTTSAVPEPSSTTLLGLGGLALMLRRRRKE